MGKSKTTKVDPQVQGLPSASFTKVSYSGASNIIPTLARWRVGYIDIIAKPTLPGVLPMMLPVEEPARQLRPVTPQLLHEPATLSGMNAQQTPPGGGDEIDRTNWDQPERWVMFTPWKPEIPDEQRIELARRWLEFLGLEATEERVARIKRHVMLYHPLSPKGQVANELVRQDKIPNRIRIEREYPQWKQRVQERDQAQGRALLTDPSVPARVGEVITSYRAAHGVGPLWREVARELDLPSYEAVAVVLEALKLAGFITFTPEERSLDVA